MPLSEFYKMVQGEIDQPPEKNTTCSTDLSFGNGNDFVEVLWEKGQLVMQGQSGRARKSPVRNNFPSHFSKSRDKNMDNGRNPRFGKFGTTDSVLNDFSMSVPSGGMGLNEDDDIVPWLDYPIEYPLQHGYCSDYLPDISGVTANTFGSIDKGSGSNQSSREPRMISLNYGVGLEQGNLSNISSNCVGEATRPRTSKSQTYLLPSQKGQPAVPSLRSRVSDSLCSDRNNTICHNVCKDQIQLLTTPGEFSEVRMQKKDSLLPSSNSGVMNFSHFSRPAAVVKANIQNIVSRTGSGLSNVEKMGRRDIGSASSSRPPTESMHLNLSNGLREETASTCQPALLLSKLDPIPSLEATAAEELVVAKQSEANNEENVIENARNPNQIPGKNATKGLVEGDKSTDPVVASSVCSGNTVERPSDDPIYSRKRKHSETEESECPSEDADEDSAVAKRAATARRITGSRRSRAAEVHNLSERKRRDKINEKMRALQELVPNCSKVDKASMLDEAIEYLKTLQLQVQIMSIGAGLYMPPMMVPPGMQHLHAAHMAYFSPMAGLGMGMNFGMGMPDMNGGSPGFPLIPVPPMQGAHFPCPPISAPTALHGVAGSNFQYFGLPCQGLPVTTMPCAPTISLPGTPHTKSSVELNAASRVVRSMRNLDSAPASCSKDPIQNITSQLMQNIGTNNLKLTPGQCQATNEEIEQSALVQNDGQASDANVSGRVTNVNRMEISNTSLL